MRTILTDVDGVLLYWKKAFEDYVRNVLKLPITKDWASHYHVEDWLDIHPDEATRIISEFHDGDALSTLPPFDDALEYIPKFVEDGWRFVAITACGPADITYRMRKQNLETCFGPIFDHIHTVGVHDSKEHWLSKYDPTIWVEDTWRHANAGHRLGHKAFLIDREYNTMEAHEGPTVVTGWKEIYEYSKNIWPVA